MKSKYAKEQEIRGYIERIKYCADVILKDAEQLTTGNLSHHKEEIKAFAKDILKGTEDIKPLAEEIREMFLDQAGE